MNKKIRIGFINYSLDVGGIETLILEIVKRLNRDLFEPAVFVFAKDGKLRSEYINCGIPVIEVPKRYGFDWLLSIRLSKILKQRSIDIVHTHNPSNWLYGGIAAKLAGIPLVHTEHTTSDYNNRHVKRWELIERILAKFTRTITTVSESVKRHMVEKSHIDFRKIRVIYNAIKFEEFDVEVDKAKVKQELSLKTDDVVIGNVARFYENKDHKTLLQAFKIVLSKFQHAYLVLVGDGPLKSEIEKLAKSLGLAEKVKFLGNRRDIPALLKVMDLFVLSSKREGFPIAILEAMVSGLPVVATDVDGTPEAVIDGETGLLVPAANPALLAQAIESVLSEPQKAKKMGEAGRQRVRQNFSFEKMVSEYEGIYKSIALKKEKPRRICVIGEFPPPGGGMGLQAQLLVNNLKKEGLQVCTIRRNIHFVGILGWLNRVKAVRSLIRFFLYIMELIAALGKAGVWHIFSNSYWDFFLYTYPAVILGRLFGKKVIIHYHGGSAAEFFRKFAVLVKPAMKMADKVIIPSGFLQDIFANYGITTEIIPNLCNLDSFTFKVRESFLPNFIVTRHLEEKYNIQCAIKAFEIVKKKYAQARLKIVGGGSQENKLKALTRELGLSDAIEFTGRVDNNRIVRYYREADIFLNPSNVDNMPVSVLEAFACGLPVVSANSGGLKYMIEDGKTGLLTAVNNSVAMANRICELIDNQKLAGEVAANAREAVGRYSWENIRGKWLEIYNGK